jgi:DHA3 family tetracycline resistance protein-like MFS transporter
MLGVTAGISLAMVAFALAPFLVFALVLYLVMDVLRDVSQPLQAAWINQKLDSRVRATVHSLFGQVDAVGQIAGGPGVGLVASLASVAAAISTSGLLLTPALVLIGRANRQSLEHAEAESAAAD